MGSDRATRPVERLGRLLVDERGEIGLVYLYAAVAGLLGLALPVGVQAIIGLVGGGMLLQPVVLLVGAVIVGTALAGGLQILQLRAVERLQQRVFARLALSWGARLPRVDVEGTLREHLPEAVNRFFEIVIIQKGLAKLLTEATAAVLTVVFGVLLLAVYHPALSIAAAVLLGGLGWALWMSGPEGLRTSLAESGAKYRVAHWLQELARRLPMLRLVGGDSLAIARTDHEVAEYLGARQAHFRVLVRQSVIAVVFRTLITGALLVLGTTLVVGRSITLGQFVAAELVVVAILAALEKLVLSLSIVFDVLTAAEKASVLGELPLERADGGVMPPRPAAAGMTLDVREVTYRYPDTARPALDGVSVRVAAGERVALSGTEGAGETTLLAVLTGLLPSYDGVATADGVSLRDVDLAALRRRIGHVAQAPRLLDGTIAENVVVGREWVSEEDVRWALDFVELGDYVARLPQGLRTRVGHQGSLPAHVTRKLALARAIAGRPSLLLFDEFFHTLEPLYKRRLLERLIDRDAGWTIVAASHDPVFLATCDRIYVLSGGRVVREGTFELLLADGDFAARLHAQSGRLVASS